MPRADPKPSGRRPLRSPQRVQAVLNALRVGNTRRAAAAAAEVSKDTFYRWLDDATFCDAVEKAEADAELRFVGVIAKAAPASWQAAAWWLERRHHEDYGRHDRTEMTMDVRKAIEELTDDPEEIEAALAEVERLAKILAKRRR
jgi:transposase